MKKNIILAAAVAALSMFASSCQKEEFVGEPAVTGEGLVFTATIDNSATKTTINTDGNDAANRGKVEWESDDEITISDGTKTAVYSVSNIIGSSATFTYKSGETLATSDVTYTAQTYSATAGDLPMTAESTTTSLTFSVTCGLLKLHLTKESESVKSIEVTGTPTGGSETTYTLTCETAQSIEGGKDFFIALPAGTYTRFVITDSEDKVCSINANNSGVTIVAKGTKGAVGTGRTTSTRRQ